MLLSQTPRPSHLNSGVKASVVGSHLEARQVVPTGYRRQAPFPSHVPSFWQLDGSSVAHALWPVAGAMPAGIGEQVPSRPARLHALQLPWHAVSQHTPSAQVRPVRHAPPAPHGSPFLPGPRASTARSPLASRASLPAPASPALATMSTVALTAWLAIRVTGPELPCATIAPPASSASAEKLSTPACTPGT